MQADAGRARVEHAAQPIRTAVVQHGVAAALRRRRRRAALRRHHFFGDDLDEPLEIVWFSMLDVAMPSPMPMTETDQNDSSNRRIFTRRRIYRASVMGVPSQTSTIA